MRERRWLLSLCVTISRFRFTSDGRVSNTQTVTRASISQGIVINANVLYRVVRGCDRIVPVDLYVPYASHFHLLFLRLMYLSRTVVALLVSPSSPHLHKDTDEPQSRRSAPLRSVDNSESFSIVLISLLRWTGMLALQRKMRRGRKGVTWYRK